MGYPFSYKIPFKAYFSRAETLVGVCGNQPTAASPLNASCNSVFFRHLLNKILFKKLSQLTVQVSFDILIYVSCEFTVSVFRVAESSAFIVRT